MSAITFRVFGDPQPKGSTRAFVRKVRGHVRAITTSANPSLAKWESLVRFEAQAALRAMQQPASPFFDAPVQIDLIFSLVRPPSASERKRPLPVVKPDLDKLTRACLDPLSGVLFRDDAQVVSIRTHKRYIPAGPAVADIRVSAMPVINPQEPAQP